MTCLRIYDGTLDHAHQCNTVRLCESFGYALKIILRDSFG
jgi:hypothetical protein